MDKLFPPHIEGKLPAFIKGGSIKVPVTMNRAVSVRQINCMYAIIKTVQTNTIMVDGFKGSLVFDSSTNSYYAVFNSANIENLNIGQFYKIQVAYGDNNENAGFYSSVGILKCTSQPTVQIPGLISNYYSANEFTGICDWGEDGDITEKVYSYCFTIKDGDNNVVASSGEQLHDNYGDTLTYSSDSWIPRYNLQEGKLYYITYQIKTINNLTATSQTYVIIQQDTVDPNFPCELVCTMDPDEGYISLYFRPTEQRALSGNFILSRACSKDNYQTWDEIYDFSYKGYIMIPRDNTTPPSQWNIKDILVWEDYTVEQGISYIYSLQAYNDKRLYSNRVLNKTERLISVDNLGVYTTDFINEPISVDFEDAFLFDGERQLKIKFNPKISSFKTNILESKIETIGGKYPFIFRNGNVSYKEFPISGLISLIGDPEEKFFKGIQAAAAQTDLDTWLTAENFKRERDFKLEVLNWLTNGEPKLFRSPAEGNYIVRLMNTSLTPNDTLGRMLHTFQSTAYEIADYNFINLKELGLVPMPFGVNKHLKIGQIKLNNPPSDFRVESNGRTIYLNSFYHVSIADATPGTIMRLDFDNGTHNLIEIGGTGCYTIPLKDIGLNCIALDSGVWDRAVLNFCYYDNIPTDNFNIIVDIKVKDQIRQIIGTGFIKDEEHNVVSDSYGGASYPIHKRLSDIKRQLGRFHIIKIRQRPMILCYEAPGGYYAYNSAGNNLIQANEWYDAAIYKVCDNKTNEVKYYMYGKSKAKIMEQPDYRFQINNGSEIYMGGNEVDIDNDGKIDLTTFGRIESLSGIESVESMYLGSGVMVELCYRVKEIQYVFEQDDAIVKDCKVEYEAACESYQNALLSNNSSTIANALTRMETTYQDYIDRLEYDIEEWSKGNYGI